MVVFHLGGMSDQLSRELGCLQWSLGRIGTCEWTVQTIAAHQFLGGVLPTFVPHFVPLQQFKAMP